MDRPVNPDEADVATEAPAATRKHSLRMILFLLLAILAAFGLWRFLASRPTGEKKMEAPVTQVGAAKVEKGDIKQVLSGLGTVTPIATITVQAQIAGQLMSVASRKARSSKGRLPGPDRRRPYQALKQQYEGQLAHDQGVLDQAKARRPALRDSGSSRTPSPARPRRTRLCWSSRAKGTVATDKALIAQEALNIYYCHIVAPVTGRVGLRLVDPGNYIRPANTNGIVVLTQLAADFRDLRASGGFHPGGLGGAARGQSLAVVATNRSDDKEIATGVVESIDNLVDTTTGTVKIRANFPNADLKLFPNQFVNARLLLRTLRGRDHRAGRRRAARRAGRLCLSRQARQNRRSAGR